VGFGTVDITVASSTTASEGGALSLAGSGIKLYYPKFTPQGDISASFASAGGLCEVQ
jgi:hypothetical protein